jgi:hypothetical protein
MMRFILILLSIIFQIKIIHDLNKRKISFFGAGSLIGGCLIGLVLLIKPNLLQKISNFFGFQLPSNFIFLTILVFLGMVNYTLQIRVNRLETKVIKLAQKISLIEN